MNKKNYATPKQVLDAFENLSDANLLALRQVAKHYIQGTRFSEPADIIHEVLHRCLNGTRHWPLNVPFPAFMNETMRSLADAERNCYETVNVLNLNLDEALEALDQDLMSSHIGFMNPEELYESKELQALGRAKIEALKQAFKNDDTAKLLLSAWANNVQPKDVVAQYRINPKDYDSARKRIARYIEQQHQRRLQ